MGLRGMPFDCRLIIDDCILYITAEDASQSIDDLNLKFTTG